MADGTVDTPVVTDDTQLSPEQELAANMALAFGNGTVPAEAAPIIENPVIQEPAAVVAEPVIVEAPVFSFETLKEKFGYEKPEDALTEIEQLRLLKANPPKADLTFENETSEKLFKAWKAGKEDEVYAYLAEKKQLENLTSQDVTKDNATELIKLGMQMKYKELGVTQKEIDLKYNQQFALPKEPTQKEDEEDTDFTYRHDEWKQRVEDIETSKIFEARVAKKDLEAAKTKLVLPELESASPDESYLNYQKMIEKQAELDAQTKEAYKTISPKDVQTKVKFTDEANKIDFEFQYEPDSESFKKAVEIASDNEKFFNTFLNSDGSPNRSLWIDAIHYATNKAAIITEAIKQGSNARIKAQLPDNGSGGLIRQMPAAELPVNELDEQMRRHGLGK